MTDKTKKWLGGLTFLPLIFIIPITIAAIFLVVSISGNEAFYDSNPDMLLLKALPVIIMAIVASLIQLALVIFYIVHAAKNQGLENGVKFLWIAVIFLAQTIGPIVYYFTEINKRRNPEAIPTYS